MEDDSTLQLVLNSNVKALHLDGLSSGEFASIVKLLEDAVVAAVGGVVGSEESEPVLSIQAIGPGSIRIVQSVSAAARAPVSTLLAALSTANFVALPAKCHHRLYDLSEKLSQMKLTATISGLGELGGTISEQTPVPAVRTTCILSRRTLYGKVLGVGGTKTVRVDFSPVSGGAIIRTQVTKEQAVQLAKMLYQEVGIVGNAKVNVGSGAIEDFEVTTILGYRGAASDPALAAQEIERIAPGAWGGVNIPEYATAIRGEDE